MRLEHLFGGLLNTRKKVTNTIATCLVIGSLVFAGQKYIDYRIGRIYTNIGGTNTQARVNEKINHIRSQPNYRTNDYSKFVDSAYNLSGH